MSRLDAGLYGIRDIASRDEMGLLGFLSCHSSLIWGYYRQGSSPLKVHSHRWKGVCCFNMTSWVKVTLLHTLSPSSNTSSSLKLSPKTRSGDITSQTGRMRDLLSGKIGKGKGAEPSGGVLCNSNIVAKVVYLRHDLHH